MARTIGSLILMMALATALTACGRKGPLEAPGTPAATKQGEADKDKENDKSETGKKEEPAGAKPAK